MPNVYSAPLSFQASDLSITVIAPAALVAPVANFSVTPSSSSGNPVMVAMRDTSSGAPSLIEWDFTNDGIYDAADAGGATRVHPYAPGTYTIRMRATNAVGSSTATQTVTITP